jgi:hypothetical protein
MRVISFRGVVRRKLNPDLVLSFPHHRTDGTHRDPNRRRHFVFIEEHRQFIFAHLLLANGTLLMKMAALPGTVVTLLSFAGSPRTV